MIFSVKEIFYTLQGEGANSGRAAVFCRFSGCNLWTGREKDRATAACSFCDTDFVGTDSPSGGKFDTPAALADAVCRHWPLNTIEDRFVVLTGGEPLLQVNTPLIDELHARGFRVAVETNGTIDVPPGIDWICVSPKGRSELKVLGGDEIKVVVPQPGLDLLSLSSLPFSYRFVQPMDGPARAENTKLAVEWCLNNPKWRLSLQSHKVIGIP